MGEVEEFTGTTTLPLDPDRVLSNAMGKLETVVIVGYDHEGREYFSSSISDAAEVTWIMRRAEWRLHQTVDDMGEDD